jgi:hypothetical protein
MQVRQHAERGDDLIQFADDSSDLRVLVPASVEEHLGMADDLGGRPRFALLTPEIGHALLPPCGWGCEFLIHSPHDFLGVAGDRGHERLQVA